MLRLPTMKVYVQHVSIDTLAESGWEMGDDGIQAENATSNLHKIWFLQRLTRRQQTVAALLADGYTRRETAQKLNVSLQAIHQIVLRMRGRLKTRGEINF